MTNDQIRDVFLAHGFTIKEGQTDLKPYVYAAANALINSTLEEAALKCDAWIADHSNADNCTYNDCDMVAVATDLANEIRGMK